MLAEKIFLLIGVIAIHLFKPIMRREVILPKPIRIAIYVVTLAFVAYITGAIVRIATGDIRWYRF